MKDPHNYRAVGWAMIAVAGALAVIGLVVLSPIGADPYFSSKIMKGKIAQFEEMKEKATQIQNKTIQLSENLQANEKPGGMFILSVYLK